MTRASQCFTDGSAVMACNEKPRVDQLPMLGMVISPLMTEILISWGPINPYGLGLMSLSPIIWKSWEFRPWHMYIYTHRHKYIISNRIIYKKKYLIHKFIDVIKIWTGCFQKKWYPKIIHFNWVFHDFHHPFWRKIPLFLG